MKISESNIGKNKFITKKHNKINKGIYTVHEDRQNHKCESCGKSFSQAGNLKRHSLIVHEGRKDHKCEFCSKSFPQAQNLKMHIQTVH